jgi:hypothetical protein
VAGGHGSSWRLCYFQSFAFDGFIWRWILIHQCKSKKILMCTLMEMHGDSSGGDKATSEGVPGTISLIDVYFIRGYI